MLPERATHACMFAHVHEKVRVILSVLQQAIYPCALAFFFFFLLKDVWFFPGRQLQSSMAAFEFARGKNMRWICLRRIHTHSSSAGVKGCKFTFPPAALKRRIELKAPAERKLVRKREEQTRVYDPIELDCIFIAASAKRSFSATVAEPPCGVPPHEPNFLLYKAGYGPEENPFSKLWRIGDRTSCKFQRLHYVTFSANFRG